MSADGSPPVQTAAAPSQPPPKLKSGYSIIQGEYKSGEKQYSKIDVSTVQKANNLKSKIVTYLEKYFPTLVIKPTDVQKNSEGTYNYTFTIYKPFTNYKDILAQYNKNTPGFSVKLTKKYAATK